MSWFKRWAKSNSDVEVVAVESVSAEPTGFLKRLVQGLSKTRDALSDGLARVILGKKEINAELFEELETVLLSADVGVEATQAILADLTARSQRKELKDPEALMQALRTYLEGLLLPCEKPLEVTTKQPYVILMVGVNGAGKTTTIGKLAKHLQQQDKSILLAAGDTFRAAAVEQLQVWGERNRIPVITQPTGADSASVIFDAIHAAKARQVDVVIADTAGRLHTKSHLMEELKKVVRVIQKCDPEAPHEILLVIDASMGQNALNQAVQFSQAVPVSGVVLTKLDGTAKGGIIFAIAKQLKLPIRFIGVGEQLDDLRPFVASDFIAALL